VAADVVSLRLGNAGSTLISALVVVSCLGAIHGTLFTGARVYYALGIDHPTFRWLGVWDGPRGVPLRSLIAQTATTLGLVLAFGLRPGSFDRLVAFTAPFYWGFISLVGIALVIARQRGKTGAGYRVPGYPVTPILFAASSAAMVYAALDYAAKNPAWEMLWGVVVFVAGVVAWGIDRASTRGSDG
jgi:amino acid transporter